MIGTQGAAFLVLLTVIAIGFWGAVAGVLTRLLRRRPWDPKAALFDAALATDVAIVLFFLGSQVEALFGLYQSLSTPVLVIAIASVVVWRWLPPRTPQNRPPSR